MHAMRDILLFNTYEDGEDLNDYKWKKRSRVTPEPAGD